MVLVLLCKGFEEAEVAIPVDLLRRGGVEVALCGSGSIYYTTDASTPNSDSIPYTGPITLTETTVIRAVCLEEGKAPSSTLDLTYVINENDSLPVVTIVTDPDNLWDPDTGIYALGRNYEAGIYNFFRTGSEQQL